MTHELFYTSAPRGLQPGSSGFCTVAETRGLSPLLRERLEELSDYRPLFPPGDPQAERNPVALSHLRLTVSGKTFSVLSRVGPAPHESEANRFAHHVVLENRELPPGGPAWLLEQAGFLETAWDGHVRTLSRGRAPLLGERPPGPCRRWHEVTGDAGWAGVVADSAVKEPTRPIYLLYAAGVDPLPLLVEALSLLPPERRWQVTFSTYFTQLPQGVACSWRCVPLEAPDAERAPGALVLRLDRSQGKAPPGPLTEAARTGRSAPPPPRTTGTRPHTAPAHPPALPAGPPPLPPAHTASGAPAHAAPVAPTPSNAWSWGWGFCTGLIFGVALLFAAGVAAYLIAPHRFALGRATAAPGGDAGKKERDAEDAHKDERKDVVSKTEHLKELAARDEELRKTRDALALEVASSGVNSSAECALRETAVKAAFADGKREGEGPNTGLIAAGKKIDGLSEGIRKVFPEFKTTDLALDNAEEVGKAVRYHFNFILNKEIGLARNLETVRAEAAKNAVPKGVYETNLLTDDALADIKSKHDKITDPLSQEKQRLAATLAKHQETKNTVLAAISKCEVIVATTTDMELKESAKRLQDWHKALLNQKGSKMLRMPEFPKQ